MPKPKSLLERLESGTERTSSCWLWLGHRIKDKHGNPWHGRISAGGRGNGTLSTHRAAWIVRNGPIPEGMQVLHTCDVPHCVNPDHLFLGTQADNVADMAAKGRRGRTGPKAGTNYRSGLSDADIMSIREESKTQTNKALAAKYGVSPATISNINTGKYNYLVS